MRACWIVFCHTVDRLIGFCKALGLSSERRSRSRCKNLQPESIWDAQMCSCEDKPWLLSLLLLRKCVLKHIVGKSAVRDVAAKHISFCTGQNIGQNNENYILFFWIITQVDCSLWRQQWKTKFCKMVYNSRTAFNRQSFLFWLFPCYCAEIIRSSEVKLIIIVMPFFFFF